VDGGVLTLLETEERDFGGPDVSDHIQLSFEPQGLGVGWDQIGLSKNS
jgi:hypothetical protein